MRQFWALSMILTAALALASPLLAAETAAAKVKGFQPNETPLSEGGLTGGRGTLDGWTYRYRSDGKGSVADAAGHEWHVECKTDKITDKRDCTILNEAPHPVLLVYDTADNLQGVCLVFHDYPGRSGFLRVDQNPAMEFTKGCAETTPAQHKLILSGKQMITRAVHWPKAVNVDDTMSLAGLSKAEALMRFLLALK